VQHRQWAWLQLNRLLTAPELVLNGIKPKRTKNELVFLSHVLLYCTKKLTATNHNPNRLPLFANRLPAYALYHYDDEMPGVTKQAAQTSLGITEKPVENSMPTQEPALPTNRAFVVQFRAQAEAAPLHDEGRVEHLVSGQATHFSSWEELRRFIEQILTSVAEKPP
jgi:hypothetical protein